MALVTIDNVLLTVTEPINDGGVIKFKVSVCANSASEETLGYVYRRFSEFDAVFRRLHAMNPIPPLPPLPEKRVFGNNEPAFVEARRLQIQTFLRGIQANRDLQEDHEFLTLIHFPPPNLPTRTVAHALFTGGSSRKGRSKNALEAAAEAQAKATTAVRVDPMALRGAAEVAAATAAPSVLGGSAAVGAAATAAAAGGVPDMELPDWIVHPLVTPHETSVLAARGWLRSTPYKLVRLLPNIAARRQSKTYLELADVNGAPLILAVYPPRPTFACEGWESKSAYLYRLLGGLPKDRFFTAEDSFAESGYCYVVRRMMPKGSAMDQLFNAKRPLDPAEQKHVGKPKIPSTETLAKLLFHLAVTCRALHMYNIPIPALHLGNVFIDDEGRPLLSDFESAVLGATWSPTHLSFTETPSDEVTHIDVLRFGLLVVQLATGLVPSFAREIEVLEWCGEPWMPSWTPRTDGDNEDGSDSDDGAATAVASTLASPQGSIRGGGGGGAAGGAAASPARRRGPTWPEMPEPVLDLVTHIFPPRRGHRGGGGGGANATAAEGAAAAARSNAKADWDSILARPLFRKIAGGGSSSGGSRASAVTADATVPDVVLPLKKKEVALYAGAAAKWQEFLELQEAAAKRHEEGKEATKELARRRKLGLTSSASSSPATTATTATMTAAPARRPAATSSPAAKPPSASAATKATSAPEPAAAAKQPSAVPPPAPGKTAPASGGPPPPGAAPSKLASQPAAAPSTVPSPPSKGGPPVASKTPAAGGPPAPAKGGPPMPSKGGPPLTAAPAAGGPPMPAKGGPPMPSKAPAAGGPPAPSKGGPPMPSKGPPK